MDSGRALRVWRKACSVGIQTSSGGDLHHHLESQWPLIWGYFEPVLGYFGNFGQYFGSTFNQLWATSARVACCFGLLGFPRMHELAMARIMGYFQSTMGYFGLWWPVVLRCLAHGALHPVILGNFITFSADEPFLSQSGKPQ